MRKKARMSSTSMILLMIFVCMVCAGSAHSAEFRPYDLPANSQQRTYVPEQRAKPEAGRVVDESTYVEFQRKVDGMTPKERAELREYFLKKKDQAKEQLEYKYYSRLVEILEKK